MQTICAWACSLILFVVSFHLRAQDSTSFELSGYAEVYYGTQQGGAKQRPDFLYNHTENGPAVNLAWVKYTIRHNRWQLTAAPMLGTYVKRNLASEPNAVQHIYEASLGYRINSNSRLDFGILPSHIGIESNMGAQQINVTRGLLAENTPYYECGLRWSGTNENGLKWALLVLNGWQRIALDEGRNWPSFGIQIQHVNAKGRVLNYSNYMGTIGDRVTIYHNTYGQWNVANNWRVQTELNYESVPAEKDFVGYSLSVARIFAKKWAAACRVEQVRDNRGQFFRTTYAPVNLNPGGWSLNVDYTPYKQLKCRVEARRLWSAKGERIDVLPVTSALWMLTASASVSF
jgi:Putative beta-barrel porin-2, OmpL-like. bbp2